MIQRYGIYWVNLDPTEGRETQKTWPCVVVSLDAMHQAGMAGVCPLTTQLHPTWAHRVQIVCQGKPAEIMPDQIRAVSVSRFGKQIDTLRSDDSETLRHLIVRLFGTS